MVEMDGVDFDRVPTTWMAPEEVAERTVGSLGRKPLLIPGAANKFQRFVFSRLLPRRAAGAVWGTLMRRVTATDLQ